MEVPVKRYGTKFEIYDIVRIKGGDYSDHVRSLMGGSIGTVCAIKKPRKHELDRRVRYYVKLRYPVGENGWIKSHVFYDNEIELFN